MKIQVWSAVAVISVPVALAACGGEEELQTTSGSQPLYYSSTGLWPERDIPVCWATAGDDAEKEVVERALRGRRSWTAAADVNLVGWGNCGGSNEGIHFFGDNSNYTSRLGWSSSGSTDVHLDFSATPETDWGRCVANNLDRDECIEATAIHEVGHAIGYAHEHNRDDTPASCTSNPQGSDGDTTYGDWDGLSIMAYCDLTSELSPTDRTGTDALYGARNADDPRLADYNGDGRDDLFCFDVFDGAMDADYASATARYLGTDWERASAWCDSTDTRRLFTGDFNGDGRDDLFCFDLVSGAEFIDYADVNGQFNGNDWSSSAGWCNATTTRQLLIGDFNGDGRDDLLCFDKASGKEFIDYASATGTFTGTNWTRDANFCNQTASSRIFTGDFNGDGKDDLYCHDMVNGFQFIDYADASGQFGPVDWVRAGAWCDFDNAELRIGDFSGDGLDDLLCFEAGTGRRWIDYSANGVFGGTNWSTPTAFCNLSSSRLYVGDVDNDLRDDLVCYDVRTGKRSIDYAAGGFGASNYTNNTGWCQQTSGEVH